MSTIYKVFKTLDEQIFHSEEKVIEYIELVWGELYEKLNIDFSKNIISVFLVFLKDSYIGTTKDDDYREYGILILESYSNISEKDKMLFAEWYCYKKFGNSVNFINDIITSSCIYKRWDVKLINENELKLFLRDNRKIKYEGDYKYIQHKLECNFIENIECKDMEMLQSYKNNH